MVLMNMRPINASPSAKQWSPSKSHREASFLRGTPHIKCFSLRRFVAPLVVCFAFLSVSLLPIPSIGFQQDNKDATDKAQTSNNSDEAKALRNNADLIAPAAKLAAKEAKAAQASSKDNDSQKHGFYFRIGDTEDSAIDSDPPMPETRNPRAPLVGLPDSMLRPSEENGLIQQASNTKHPHQETQKANDEPAPPQPTPTTHPIVAPVASIEGFQLNHRPLQADEQVNHDPTVANVTKNFVDPTQFKVRSEGSEDVDEKSIVVQRLPDTRLFGHMTVSATSDGDTVDLQTARAETPLTHDLVAAVKHIVSQAGQHRFPSVEMIPSTAQATSPLTIKESSARFNPNSSDAAEGNDFTDSEPSGRRGYQQDESQQRAPGEPELYSISQLKNPLSNLGYPTNNNDYGDQVPGDESVKRFGEFTVGPVWTDMVRTSISYGDPSTWYLMVETWEAPAFAHRPLYFEEVNLERYGHYAPRCQPVLSAAHFAASLVSLPYQMYVYRRCEPIYTLGHYRPGSCNPHQIHHLPIGR